MNSDNKRIIKTALGIDIIKKTINKILNKNSNMVKYWENINEPIWGVSFNVDESQYMVMVQTAFEISIQSNDAGENIISFTSEIDKSDQGSELYSFFVKEFV